MSHTFIELYTATPAWTTLPPEQRNAFFARIGAGMQQFDPARITPLAMGRIARDVPHSSDEQFYAVWRCASREEVDALVAGIAATGWHEYFTTTHAVGAMDSMAQHLADLAAL
ncbi:hypothetical protein I5T93_05365 [Stenotrophomonas maltophilia]|jgi:hypothetical protein|uniref:Uncharacterized protein n=3 Tax=Stenotrophomonas TaxID=40323 RepID=A0A0L8A5A1_9GAMM|nr:MULTISPECIES: DUF6616 family protein [Stenotrophomonas]ALA88075.1 hypothetical protein YH67_18065 [Stenotrophomonas maltophilia]EQM81114.1 hypothetical protein L681_10315 [Stenotrophomonas maltophilia MF89]HCL43401.1 hypothetical protein [Pseudomonas sp.]ALA92031.1 hypothetical protein YH68_18065 [Stenotrophomonas maltophilia]KOE97548.1 hypothetical protein W7K_18875 [Stenotrophomonas geniculata N1]